MFQQKDQERYVTRKVYLHHKITLPETNTTYLQEWLGHRDEFLAAVVEIHAPPKPQECSECEAPMKWRCVDCFGMPTFCTSCCRGFHVRAPFHRIEQWNGQTFYPSSMRRTGLILYLEHGGLECPRAPVISQRTSGAATPTLPDNSADNTIPSSRQQRDHDVLNPFDLSAISAALESSVNADTIDPSTSLPQSNHESSKTLGDAEDRYGHYRTCISYIPNKLSETEAMRAMTMMTAMLTKLRLTPLGFPALFSNSLKDMISTIMSG